MSCMAMKMAAVAAKKEESGKASGLLPQEYIDILRTYLGTSYSKLDCATLPYTALKDLYKNKGWSFPIASKDFVNGGRLVKKLLENGGSV